MSNLATATITKLDWMKKPPGTVKSCIITPETMEKNIKIPFDKRVNIIQKKRPLKTCSYFIPYSSTTLLLAGGSWLLVLWSKACSRSLVRLHQTTLSNVTLLTYLQFKFVLWNTTSYVLKLKKRKHLTVASAQGTDDLSWEVIVWC